MAVLSLRLVAPLLLAGIAHAITVTHNFDVGWVYANPDGVYNRPVIGINGQWPIPTIAVTKGDNVVIHVKNNLGNETTSLHFHGLFQNGTAHMDGPPGVTQCEIAPGGSFTYNFTVDQPGTYWYHSHTKGQYPDGLRGPFIVHDPESPFLNQYDEEIVVTLSDWYHVSVPKLIKKFMSVTNPTGAEPVPQAALLNDTQDLKVSVQPEKTYLFRLVNMAAFASQYLWFEDHDMQIVEVDGVYTTPAQASMLYLTAGQRYSVLVKTKESAKNNFAIVGSMDADLFDDIPDDLNMNVTGWLVYDEKKDLPAPKLIDDFDPFDDFALVPYDQEQRLDHVDYSITLNMKMDNLGDGANYAFFNDKTYVPPKVPSLYTAITTGSNATNHKVYGDFTNSFVLKKNDVVEIILNNDDDGKHPFHLHGHIFQVVVRAEEEAGPYEQPSYTSAYEASKSLPSVPMKRDTLMVRPNSHFVVRFRANNPGVWLFHCHLEWHVISGLIATLIESPLDLQQQYLPDGLPQDHLQVCHDTKTPVAGNAAGNIRDALDLTGQNKSPDPLPEGFTAKGYVALAISCFSAVAGMAFIGWYGSSTVKKDNPA